MTFPDISPIAFEIGPLVVRWYALAYVGGILLAQRYIYWLDDTRSATRRKKKQEQEKERRGASPPLLNPKAREDLILYGVVGIILGGRLGYVLFYNAPYYLHHPLEILQLWQGGMSFHGGLTGVLIAFYLYARRFKLRWLEVTDLLAVAAPIGLFLGRLANFVNGELYGRVTDVSWGMVFPHGGAAPRHPSQLYEAGLEGVLLGLTLWLLATRTNALKHSGMTSGVFAIGYAISRFTVEFFREPDAQLGTLALGLSMGQWLCVPMAAVGGWLLVTARGRGRVVK